MTNGISTLTFVAESSSTISSATIMTSDSGGSTLKQESDYYYDSNNTSPTTPPTKGNLTRLQQFKDSSNSVSSYYTYDSCGNKLTQVDPNSNTTTWTYDTTYHTYPATKTYPITGLSESYSYDPGTSNLLSQTDVNSQTTSYYYDTFKRLTSVAKPGDTQGSPSVTYQYNSWGTLNSQNIKTITKIDATHNIWQADYFDGLGRVVQSQAQGESGYTVISSTTAYNNRGLTDKTYVSQNISGSLSTYQTPDSSWKNTAYTYDCLGRVTTQSNPDGTTVSNDYSSVWQTTTTNTLGNQNSYLYDAFGRLCQVQNLSSSSMLYENYHATQDSTGLGYHAAQTFTPQTTHTVTQVKLQLWNSASLAGTLTVGIRATDANGVPTGSYLASGTVAENTINNAWTTVTVSLGNGCQVNQGTKYAIQMDTGYADGLYAQVDAAGTYAGGIYLSANQDMSYWNDHSQAYDIWFEEWAATASTSVSFIYDGNGSRVKRTEAGVTTLYINQYYEKTGTGVTTHYYLGGKQVALC